MDAAAKTRLDHIGLSHIPFIMYDHIDWPLIYAFVERWQPDTNSFHLPFGEITIMLHDVQLILGIPVDGSPVHLDGDTDYLRAVTMQMLSVTEEGLGPYWD